MLSLGTVRAPGGQAGDRLGAGHQFGDALGLLCMQSSQFVQRARGGTSAGLHRGVDHRRQAVALLVLRDLGVGVRGAIADDDRHFMKSDALRGPPPLGAEVILMQPRSIGGLNDDGLQDAVLSDVFHEFVELGFRDLAARVVGVMVEVGRQHHRG